MKARPQVLEMTPELFKLRRKVINNLYDARRLVNERVPFLKVRIVDFPESKTMGRAYIVKNEINISSDMKNWSDAQVKYVVFHELAHQYHKAEHSKIKDLMNPTIPSKISEAKIEKDFKALASKKLSNVI